MSMGNGKLIVLIQVVLMEPQALKLHKNFDHLKYSLHNKKNINFWAEYSLFLKPSKRNYLHLS